MAAVARAVTPWLTLLVALTAAGLPNETYADDEPAGNERWLVVPACVPRPGQEPCLERLAAREWTASLADLQEIFPSEQARLLFEERGSSPPVMATSSDIDALARDASQALYHVAIGLSERARADVKRAMQRAERALESLNRESRSARHLLDACLFVVRAHLQSKQRDQAVQQALECRRMSPDITPRIDVHPPEVIGLLAEADAELLARQGGSLRVESLPPGCAVYVNGRNLGTTPKELARLSPGEYRIQVECVDGEFGRVHRVTVGSERVVMRIDTRFEATVQTTAGLSLRYSSSTQAREHARYDAAEAARVVGVSHALVLWSEPGPGASGSSLLHSELLRASDGALLGGARLAVDRQGRPVRADYQRAAGEIAAGRFTDLTGETPVAFVPYRAEGSRARGGAATAERTGSDSPRRDPDLPDPALIEAERDTGEPATAMLVTGWSVGGLGLAGSAVGWGLYAHLLGLQSDYARTVNRGEDYFEALRDIDTAEPGPRIALGAGSVALAAALPLVLPDERGVPLWAWLTGGAGLAVAATGTALSVTEASCEIDGGAGRCTDPMLAAHLGQMLLLQSLPLLSVPVTYGVRELVRDQNGSLSLSLGPRRAAIGWRGVL